MAVRDELHANKDLVVAIVGVVVLSVLTASMFFIEQIQFGPGEEDTDEGTTFEVNFTNSELQTYDLGDQAGGTLQAGEETVVQVAGPAPNVTSVQATLSWSQDGQQDIDQDEFYLAIDGPEATSCQSGAARASGSIVQGCTGVDVPDPVNVTAANESEALRTVGTVVPANLSATGTYDVTIALNSTGNDNAVDDSNSYELTFQYRAYEPDAAKALS